jgi:mannitol/fructose-specific phosphotransferase system IIA component (Ntr-type)
MPQLDFAQLLDPARVLILPGQPSKALAISALAEIATSGLSAHDRVQFIRAVLEREDVTSTAIGSGVAIPHARTGALDRCRLAVGVLQNGVSWGAADGKPVHLALLIAARESDHAEHLRVMAGLAVRLRKPGLAERLRTFTDRQAIIDALLAV